MASEFVGTEQRGGLPVPARPEVDPPPHWRLEAVAATERPRDLVLAPDGCSVAFILDRDTSDVWTLALGAEPQPGTLRRITTGRALMPYWEDTKPAWSPDGTRIVYADGGELFVVAAAGGPPQRLCEAGNPMWLDDQRIVVTVERDRCTRLAVVEVDDPSPQTLAAGNGDCGAAAIAPDRERVAFVFWPHDDRNRSDIRIVNERGDEVLLSGTPGMQARARVVTRRQTDRVHVGRTRLERGVRRARDRRYTPAMHTRRSRLQRPRLVG